MDTSICWAQSQKELQFSETNSFALSPEKETPFLSFSLTFSYMVVLTDLSWEVNGETTDASASLKAIPTCAARSAPQSLPPSPHMPTTRPWSRCKFATNTCMYYQAIVLLVQHLCQMEHCIHSVGPTRQGKLEKCERYIPHQRNQQLLKLLTIQFWDKERNWDSNWWLIKDG